MKTITIDFNSFTNKMSISHSDGQKVEFNDFQAYSDGSRLTTISPAKQKEILQLLVNNIGV